MSRVLARHVVMITASVVAASGSSTNMCSLNGIWNPSNGACSCDPGWKGGSCAELDLAPVRANRMGLANASNPTWGGTAIFEGNRWHLIVGARAVDTGSYTSENYPCDSKIVRAQTDGTDPTGPWSIVEDVIPRVSWEPAIVRTPRKALLRAGNDATSGRDLHSDHEDGPLVMLFFGNQSSNKPEVGAPICSINSAYLTNMTMYWTTSPSGSVAGPWTEPRQVLGMENKLNKTVRIAGRGTVVKEPCAWYCSNGNPGPAYHPNGTLYAIMRSDTCDQSCQQGEHLSLWRADDGPGGEWTLVSLEPLFGWGNASSTTCNESINYNRCYHNEDPHLWIDERGWHVLSHNQNSKAFDQRGGYGWSLDGLKWTFETMPLADPNVSAWSIDVQLANGTVLPTGRR